MCDLGKLGRPVVDGAVAVGVKHPVRISGLGRWVDAGRGVDGCCEFKVASLFIAIKMATDLGIVVTIVGVLPGCLDEINMQTFCNICGPLGKRS